MIFAGAYYYISQVKSKRTDLASASQDFMESKKLISLDCIHFSVKGQFKKKKNKLKI